MKTNSQKFIKLKVKVIELERIQSLMEVCRSNENLNTPELIAIADTLMVAQNRLYRFSKPYQKKLRKLKGGEV